MTANGDHGEGSGGGIKGLVLFVLDWRDGKPFPVDIGLDNRVKDGSSNPSAPHHSRRLDRLFVGAGGGCGTRYHDKR